MKIKKIGVIAGVLAGLLMPVIAQAQQEASLVLVRRDATYEQYLKFSASPDTAITPTRVLRWLNTLMGHSTVKQSSNFEFQPIVRARNHQEQFIAQFVYKF